jgi:integrase/recombinase XerC
MLYSKTLSKNTADSYINDLYLFIEFLSRYSSEEINLEAIKCIRRQDLRSWFLERINKRHSSKSIARGLSAIKCFFKFMIDLKLMEDHPVMVMRPPKVGKSLPRPLTVDQVNTLINSVKEYKKTGWMRARDEALLVLTYSVGLRISEVLGIKLSDISITSSFINITGKGGKVRSVPLINKVKNIILQYVNSRPSNMETEFLFVNKSGARLSASAIQKLVRRIRRSNKMPETITPHALRHTCATHIMENSRDIRGVQDLLGHSSISSTQIYADVSSKYISDIYDNYHPMSASSNKKDDKK